MLRISLSLALAAVLASPVAHAQSSADERLTIKLDAESTQANGVDGSISFRGISITQGDTFIKADVAQSSGLDFLNSTWTFTGNVEFGARGTNVSARQAVVDFREQVLISATLEGSPVNFRQNAAANVRLTSNSARLEFTDAALNKAYFTGTPVEYEQSAEELMTNARADSVFFDAGAGIITLQDNAWIGEGTREITGNRISYNYEQRNVVAASNAEGSERVTITITPPSSDE
ncbi:MAG: LptA/OstA family protein [Gammaproteobacteria bacterium]